jgi:hypothetical protein
VLESDDADIELARRLALGYAAVDVVRAADMRLAAAVSAGAASFERETSDVAPGLRATPDSSTPSFAAGVELRAAYALIVGAAARLSIELSAGALVVPAAPVLRFATGAPEPRDEPLWLLQPELRLGPHLRLRL